MVASPAHPQRIRLRAEIAPVDTTEVGIIGFCIRTSCFNIGLCLILTSLSCCIIDGFPHLCVDIVESHLSPGFKHGFKSRLDSLVGTLSIIFHFSKSLSYGSTEILDGLYETLHLRETIFHCRCHLISISQFGLLSSTLGLVNKLLVLCIALYESVIIFSSLHTSLHQLYLWVGREIGKTEIREEVCTLTEKIALVLYFAYAFLLGKIALIGRPPKISDFLSFVILFLLGCGILIRVLDKVKIKRLPALFVFTQRLLDASRHTVRVISEQHLH